MSKYHPLDVRHPANRDRERNSYLLAPPDDSTYALRTVEKSAQAPSRRSADYRSKSQTTVVETPVTVAPSRPSERPATSAPWGGNSTASTQNTALIDTPRRSVLPKLIVFGVVAYVILNNFNLMDEIVRFVTRTVNDLGL